jgi:hypothetical protein
MQLRTTRQRRRGVHPYLDTLRSYLYQWKRRLSI